jgi:hypothetical protein
LFVRTCKANEETKNEYKILIVNALLENIALLLRVRVFSASKQGPKTNIQKLATAFHTVILR